MGMMGFKYQAAIENGQSREQVAAKITEVLQGKGYVVGNQGGDLAVSGLKGYFNAGTATIRIDDKFVSVTGNVKPSVPGIVCIAISVVFDLIGLFKTIGKLDDLLVVLVTMAFGAAGTVGSIITFLFGKEFLRQELAQMIDRATR